MDLREGAIGRSGFISAFKLWTDDEHDAASEILARIKQQKLEFVRLSFADQHGILRGKMLVASEIESVFRSGCAIPVTLLGKDTANRTLYPVFSADGGFGLSLMGGAGDMLMVTCLDRLARSTRDLLNTLAAIGDRKAGFRSLGDAWADTTTAHGRLMLTVLGGLAEFESELIRTRAGEGRARAKAAGKSLGRKPKLTPHQKEEAIRRRDEGASVRAIARTYNVSASTISRLTA